MKKPKTYKELLEWVNPKDLLEVLDFCGYNDHKDKEHSKLRQYYSSKVWESIREYNWKHPILYLKELKDDFYETVVKCIQDFYYWGHRFNHEYGHIYKRVVNALEIPKEDIDRVWRIKNEA